MQIQHNLLAMNSNRMLGITGCNQAGITEKLSSGYRINRAADDAAGLSISEKMRKQIRGLTQAARNCQDGISMVQTAEGAMNELHEMAQRGNELAIQAANGTLSDTDRLMVDQEVQALKEAIDGMVGNAKFNELRLFPEQGITPTKSMSSSNTKTYELLIDVVNGNITVVNPADSTGGSGSADGVADYPVLADKIANEYFPNAISQILTAFPSFQTALGSTTVPMTLEITTIDGASNTLAYAQCSFGSTGPAVNLKMVVDKEDFNDSSVSGSKAEELESTIAHELMHSVMQYTMTDEMTGRAGTEFTDWFSEGTAQLSGGGFPTNWNAALEQYAGNMTGASDTSQDAAIAAYLKQYTVAGRPYGHGYLACAYLGWKANGGGAVTGAGIAAGMDKIFSNILNGGTLYSALSAETGLSLGNDAAVEALFSNPSNDLVSFVRQLAYATKGGSNDGAGSVIAPSLSTGGEGIIGNTVTDKQAFYVTNVDASAVEIETDRRKQHINIQAGAETGITIEIPLYKMDTKALGINGTHVKTETAATKAIDQFAEAIHIISKVRSDYGAIQNRLEHTINNLDNIVENTTDAESRIRDTDMAEYMVEYSNNNILLQAGQSVLAQANKYNEAILKLLA